MAGYLGHKPKLNNYTVDEFTTSAAQASSGNFTLSQTVTDSKTLEVSVGGIDQPQSAYSVSGTTLAFGASIVSENDIVIARHAGESIMYPALEDSAVTSAKIAAGAVGTTDIADDAVTLAKLSATGTASSSNFLRGDNSWQEAGGGAWGVKTSGTFSSVSTVTFSGFTKTTKIIIPNIVTSTATQIKGRVGTGAGPTIITASHYSTDSQQFTNGSSSSQNMTADHIALLSSVNAVAAEPGALEIDLFVPESTAFYTNGRWVSSSANAQHNIRTIVGAFRYGYQDTATTAVTAFQIYPASGTISGSYIVLELN